MGDSDGVIVELIVWVMEGVEVPVGVKVMVGVNVEVGVKVLLVVGDIDSVGVIDEVIDGEGLGEGGKSISPQWVLRTLRPFDPQHISRRSIVIPQT